MSDITAPLRIPVSHLSASTEAYALIQKSEGFRYIAYADVGGRWTIGWGHTRGVREGDHVTAAEGHVILVDDVLEVEHQIRSSVDVPMTQGEFDALVDWIFNLGAQEWLASPARHALNEGDYASCIQHMHKYVDAAGRARAGLIVRRNSEYMMWRNWE